MAQAKAVMLANPHATIEGAHRAEPLALAISDQRAREMATASALWLQGDASDRLDDVERAVPLMERAFALVSRAAPGSKLHADILLTRGSIAGKQLQVAQALRDFQSAHRLFRANGDRRHEAIALICMANLYVDAKDYAAALRYLDEALEAFPADAGLAYAIYNTRGLVLQDQGRYGAADVSFKQAFRNARLVNGGALQAIFLRNIARNQLLAGKVDAADRTISSARQASAGGDGDGTQLDALAAQAALQRGRFELAGRLIDRAFVGVDPAQTDVRFRYAHLTAVGAFRALHQDGKALAHLDALKRLDDDATKLATQTSSALMAANFDSANRDAKIAQLRDAERLRLARDELQRARTERSLFLIGSGAAAAIMALLAIALVMIRRSRDQVRAANADLTVTNGALGKALAAKTEFLATTSHEIRTPLNGILGMTQVMLADAKVAGPTRDRLTVVHGAGMTMRALVDDILDVAKMETGNLGLDLEPFDPAVCIREATAMWVDQAAAKGLTLDIDLARCPPRLMGDAARVRQIVFNLLSNAFKFTAAGGITVVSDAALEGGLRIAIRDTGIGIAANKQAEVFESFRQADTSTTRQFGGTGLGLTICRNLVEAMNGTLTLVSEVGRGSTFTVILPLPVLEAAQDAQSGAGPTLLVIERNPIARAMLRTLLSPHVAQVAFAGSVDEAVATCATNDVVKVLIDGTTAQASGDAAAFIAAVLAAAPGISAMLLWPAGHEDALAALPKTGLRQILPKPVTGVALVTALFNRYADEIGQERLVSQAA